LLHRGRAAFEDIGYQINRIADIGITIAISVTSADRVGRRTAFENVCNQEDSIADINSKISVGIAAYNPFAGITNAITIGVFLTGIIDIRAVIPLVQTDTAAEGRFLPTITVTVNTFSRGIDIESIPALVVGYLGVIIVDFIGDFI
jgi:hypothetical protein